MPIAEHVAQSLCAALDYPPERAGEVARALAKPPTLALGDCAFPCFQLAKERRAPPPKIAAGIAARIAPDEVIDRAVAQGPYVNVYLRRPATLRSIVGEVLRQPETYGSRNLGKGALAIVEFSSPNIAKPFHFGHLRSTNIGADIARILAFEGWRVLRRNYIGDWGTQFGFVIYAWQQWGEEEKLQARAIDYLVELYVRANQESERDPGVREQARKLFLRLEQGDPEIAALWQHFRELSLAGFMKTYERLGIAFESYEGEAAGNARMQPVIDRFVAAGVAVKSEGALVVEVADVIGREIAPLMLQKTDGASTYAARDCAEAIDRWEKHAFGANIYVVSRQEDHFAQLFAALGRLGRAEGWQVDWPARCENVSFGFVRGMSTRKGEAVWLEHVLDEARDRARRVREEKSAANPRAFPALSEAELERVSESVGQAALLYFDVSSRRLSDVSFDWDTVLQFEGNTGPYLQYTHARMRGLFRKAVDTGFTATPEFTTGETIHDEEWALALQLQEFGDVVESAAANREPHEIARYLHDLASAFNAFYNQHTVIDPADRETTLARLALVQAAQVVLAQGLRLLGIRPLEFM
jgi:arginyl-tRNA synthetase